MRERGTRKEGKQQRKLGSFVDVVVVVVVVVVFVVVVGEVEIIAKPSLRSEKHQRQAKS